MIELVTGAKPGLRFEDFYVANFAALVVQIKIQPVAFNGGRTNVPDVTPGNNVLSFKLALNPA